MINNSFLINQNIIYNTNTSLILFGLFLIFLFLLFKIYTDEMSANNFLYLGLFDTMFALSIYSFYYEKNNCIFLFLGLSVIPLIKVFQCFCNIKYNHIINLLIRFTLITTTLVFLLDNFSIFSVKNSDTVIYVSLFLTLLVGVILSVNIYREKEISIKFSISNLILILGIIIGTLSENFLIILLSICTSSLIYSVSIMENFLNSYKSNIISYIKEKLIYKDVLTSMKNRHSFEKQIEFDDENIGNYSSYWSISIDIDDLKYINNNFGYSHGDRVIKALSENLENSFGEIGKCFRIGGDEFVILIKNESEEKVERYLELFQLLISSYNKIHDIKLIVSIGYDSYKFGYDKSIFDLITRTDYIMCKNKKKVKSYSNSTNKDDYFENKNNYFE